MSSLLRRQRERESYRGNIHCWEGTILILTMLLEQSQKICSHLPPWDTIIPLISTLWARLSLGRSHARELFCPGNGKSSSTRTELHKWKPWWKSNDKNNYSHGILFMLILRLFATLTKLTLSPAPGFFFATPMFLGERGNVSTI